MARGRMLNKSVCLSLKFNQLPDDTCRLLATWTISHLDFHGVFYADPAIVRSMIFPRRTDVSIEQVERYLQAMGEIGLIILFEAKGQLWQWWPGFADNQVGLRADRESTDFPPPPDDSQRPAVNVSESFPQVAVNLPAEGESKSTESKQQEKAPPSEAKAPPTVSPQAMFSALARVCRYDLKTIDNNQRGKLNQTEKILREAGACPQDLDEFDVWWFRHDWRGKKNREPPEPNQVREEWGRFTVWRAEKQLPPPSQVTKTPADELAQFWRSIVQASPSVYRDQLAKAHAVERRNSTLVITGPQTAQLERLRATIERQAADFGVTTIQIIQEGTYANAT